MRGGVGRRSHGDLSDDRERLAAVSHRSEAKKFSSRIWSNTSARTSNGSKQMPIDVDDGIFAALREAGSSDAQIADAKLVLAPLCELKNNVCILSATGAALESPKWIAWLQANEPHLLPAANQVADAELAFTGTGNKTAAQRLISELGKAEADRIAALYGKPHALSTCRGSRRIASKKTPAASRLMQKQSMVRDGWNVTKQGSIVRSLGIEKQTRWRRHSVRISARPHQQCELARGCAQDSVLKSGAPS
jgi:hypothetical protein